MRGLLNGDGDDALRSFSLMNVIVNLFETFEIFINYRICYA